MIGCPFKQIAARRGGHIKLFLLRDSGRGALEETAGDFAAAAATEHGLWILQERK